LIKKVMFVRPGLELSFAAARNLVDTCTGVVFPELFASHRLRPDDAALTANVASSRAGSQTAASWTRSAADRSDLSILTFCSGMSACANQEEQEQPCLVGFRSSELGIGKEPKTGEQNDRNHRQRPAHRTE
jgi:hypothetical protein